MCSILVNDILDELKCDNYRLLNDLWVLREENQRFLNDLCLERQLNHILDNYKNYSLVLINRCKCEISQQLVDQLNRFNDEYNGLKSRRNGQQNSVLLSGKNGKYVDTYDEVILPKNTTDDLTDTQICDDCQQVFESEMDLQIHTNSVHKNLQSFSCHECNKVFNTRDLFVIHLTQRHEFRKSGDQMDVKPDMTSMNVSPKSSPYVSRRSSSVSPQKSTPVSKSGGNSDFKLMTELLHKNYRNPNFGKTSKVVSNDNKKHHCNECKKGFNNEIALEIHVNKVHLKRKPYVCETCDANFYAKRFLLTHMSTKHKIKAFECDSCDFKTSKFDYLVSHQKRRHSAPVHHKSSPTKAKSSPQKESKEVFKCDLCQFKTSAKYSYVLHKNSHKLNKTFRCVVTGCTERFSTKESKLRHQRTKHSLKNDKQFGCDNCDQRFHSNDILLSHMADKHKIAAYVCHKCPLKTTSKLTLFRHQVKEHSLKATYVCHESGCGLPFERQANLNQHIKRKHQLNGSTGAQSPSKAKKSVENKANTFTTTGSTPSSSVGVFKCDITGCRKKCKTQHLFIVHKQRVHSMVHTYVCEYNGCNRRFKSCKNFNEHKKQHNEKFVCKWKGCPFRTDTFAKLNQHKRQLKHHSNNL